PWDCEVEVWLVLLVLKASFVSAPILMGAKPRFGSRRNMPPAILFRGLPGRWSLAALPVTGWRLALHCVWVPKPAPWASHWSGSPLLPKPQALAGITTRPLRVWLRSKG